MLKKLAAIFLLALSTTALFGQAFSGSVTGIVSDASQAAVPNAEVKIKNAATDDTRRTATGTDGRYVLSQLPPGEYVLTVEAKGFKTFSSGQFTLRANQAAEVNAAMALGQITETVEVRDSAGATGHAEREPVVHHGRAADAGVAGQRAQPVRGGAVHGRRHVDEREPVRPDLRSERGALRF